MVTVLEGERLYRLSTAVEKATGVRPSPSTLWRWKKRRQLPIPFVTVGGTDMTSLEAIHRWNLAATADRVNPQSAATRTRQQREHAIRAAERELDKAGI